MLSFRTGKPLSFTGNNSLNLGSGGNTTLEQIAPVEVLGGIGPGHRWFSTTSFARTPTNVQGSSGRNIFDGPSLFALNASLSRTMVLREDIRLQLRLESFNVTNTTQFGQPNTSWGNNFGFITTTLGSGTGVNGTGGGRSVQLGAKISF